jgi:hypothetical protein
MTRPTVLAALAALVLMSVAPPVWSAQCAPSQVKPHITKPGSGSEVSSPVSVEGTVEKPAGCTAPTFTNVNLEFYRKAPGTSGQPLQPVPGTWGDVRLQNGAFVTTKQLPAGAYLRQGKKLVQAGTEGNYWGATETISFTVKPASTLNPNATKKLPNDVVSPKPVPK